MVDEIWKDIEGYSRKYQISNLGRFKTFYRKEIISDFSRREALYIHVGLYIGNKRFHLKVHRLVAAAFIPNPENKPDINHINGNKHDNRVENLEWCTKAENTIHAIANGLFPMIGEGCHLSKLTKANASYIKNSDMSLAQLSKEFGVTKQSIYYIKKGKSWKAA